MQTEKDFNKDINGLVDLIKKGDEQAFEKVYESYYSKLFYFTCEFIPYKDIAENIVQDTFLTLWKKRKELTDNTNLGAYLYTVAKNNCLYKLRDQRYRQKHFKTSNGDVTEMDLNTELLQELDSSSFVFDEIEKIIQQTLNELPPRCKEVFILSRYKDMKNREIAELLDISEKVVEKHISKALKRFKVSLKDYLPIVAYLFV